MEAVDRNEKVLLILKYSDLHRASELETYSNEIIDQIINSLFVDLRFKHDKKNIDTKSIKK